MFRQGVFIKCLLDLSVATNSYENVKLNQADYITILQITDTHFRETVDGTIYGIETQILFEKTLTQIQNDIQQPGHSVDVLLVTGDISQDGSAASYQRFHEFLKPLDIPSYFLQGNHDYKAPMLKEFGAEHVAPCLVSPSHLKDSPWNIIMLNSSVENEVGGHFGSEQLAYLEKRLTEKPNAPTLLCFHHHPFPIECEWLDSQKIDDAESLFEIIKPYDNVKLCIYGHIHQDRKTQVDHVSYFASPSTCAQFKPEVDDFSLDDKAPAYRWIKLYADGRFETEIHRLKDSF